MLILSRRPGDAILIDGGIRIVVLASGQRCVRLGIEAPAEVGIVREEIVSRTPDGGVRVPVLNGLVPKAEPGAEPVAEPGPADDV